MLINPPLLNSANPWATTEEDLNDLFLCGYTGAVTTRTCLLNGFPHDDNVHQYTFVDSNNNAVENRQGTGEACGSLNTLGYSPIPLDRYLSHIERMTKDNREVGLQSKPFIISVTGDVDDVARCYLKISKLHSYFIPLAMEINLSCPNIVGKPPPAYSGWRLTQYLEALSAVAYSKEEAPEEVDGRVQIGIKTPPFTYTDQFKTLIEALRSVKPCPVDFITATNTLGSSLVLNENLGPAISSAAGTGIGGLAGAPLHPLALGNVQTLTTMLREDDDVKHIFVIGVGGVSDGESYERMRSVGAEAVAVATALGRKGVGVFEEIARGAKKGRYGWEE